MNQWTDLFLKMPMPQSWQHGLLFIAFGVHLLFVLLMLGTAMLGLMFFLQKWMSRAGAPEEIWNKKIVHTHIGFKSLAVVLGVAPLLIVQVRYSHAFFTATSLFSYAWIAVIPLLIIAFLLVDAFWYKLGNNSWLAFACGLVGLGMLLTVPAVFTGALALMERQELWPVFAERGFHIGGTFAVHWALRYLHILGAAVIFGAAFHLFFSTRKYPEAIPLLRHWLFGGTLFQVAIGIPLLFSVGWGLDWPTLWTLTLGVVAAMLALWILRPDTKLLVVGPRSLLVLLPLIFVAMVTTRQFLQDRHLAEEHAQAVAFREERSKALTPYHKQALEAFTVKLATVYDNGETIYDGACVPCHGLLGRGDGPAAQSLLIPAEDLTAIRADREYVYGILKDGTPGSAMPYFRLYDREKLERVLDTLSKRFSMFAAATKPAHEPSLDALTVWEETCSVCHGTNGEPTPFGRTLLPAAPDLRRFSLTPERALTVITEGYPGTAMVSFRNLPEEVRRDLAVISESFRSSH